ncbi:hypothetical protein B0I35DRAFT_419336 [Stachybotrys elegans]|uniref:Peroxin 26 n=1 Tax=Stachybotrys elegans TaxID=80388 RepID=A0A8K0WXC8_9HYPO|nr:hypothetical protein B0I35DRAFT_419336 [Stachybotrys elegans]
MSVANGFSSEPLASHTMRSSLSSLNSPASARHPSPLSKTYRQASTLFLTRRLPEALTTLLPLITPPASADDGEPAPVTKASKNTRVKIWSLYLTILNAVLEMEMDEGKQAFGNQDWRALCAKVRDGEIWEEVVRNGYHGVEGDVDLEVVVNSATLLLAHAPEQTLNQKRLEAYFAMSNTPTLDLSGRLNDATSPVSPAAPAGSRYRSPAKGASGANTPRDLNSRVKLLELYTLHVLVRNEEWEHAREFINASPVLDEERREAFLQALQSLHDEQHEQERLEREEQQRQEEQLRREIEETRRIHAENEDKARKKLEQEKAKRDGSEIDYGIGDSPHAADKARPTRTASNASRAPRPVASRPGAKGTAGPLTITARANMVMSRMRVLLYQLSASLNSNPILLMRLLAFILGLVLMFAKRSIRERIQRVLGVSWNKIKATAGMGTKVSYI